MFSKTVKFLTNKNFNSKRSGLGSW